MIILFWFVSLTLFLFAAAYLLWILSGQVHYQDFRQSRFNGFLDIFRNSGLSRPKYPVELWRWETPQDEDVCEDCQERASWPPMDIADWMKEGLPGTPEAETHCGEHCRCQLVRYYPKSSFSKHQRKQ